MTKPTAKEIKKFIEIFDKLYSYEATKRVNGEKGCFEEKELPFKEVVSVRSWLLEKVSIEEGDVVDTLIDRYEQKIDDLKCLSASAYSSNDYIAYETLNEEASIYGTLVKDLKDIVSY